MDPSLRSRFESKYDIWKEKLLDLSGSNRLLNFKTTKISTVKITRPSASGLFEQLVLSEQSLKFPFYRGRASVPKDIWSLSGDSRDANTRDEDWLITPGDLDTTKTPPELDKSLGKLAKLARSSREERGVNTLYLALGMLEWHPIQNAEPQLAPLLLIPVDLKRENRLEPYVLSPFDEDAEINPSLLYMLRKDFEYAAPEFSTDPDEHTLEMYLDQTKRRTSIVTTIGRNSSTGGWCSAPD
ncbi:MAG: DUF4011 domain-containing protein [Terriglobales bacterium]